VLLGSIALLGVIVSACSQGERTVVDVSIPPPLSTTTTTTIPETTTTTIAPTTTFEPTTTFAPTTTIEQPDTGPPASIDTEYTPGSGSKRRRTPCTPGPDLGRLVQGANCRYVAIDGMAREYVVYVPVGVQRETPAPLVVYLHGDGLNGDRALVDTGWKKRADSENIVVAFPTSLAYNMGTEEKPDWTSEWNGLELAGKAVLDQRPDQYPDSAPMPANDEGFVRAMVADIEYQWPIDTTKVYAVGSQSGADLTMRLALDMPDVFAAVGMIGGGPGSPALQLPVPARSVPMMLIVGTNDTNLATTSLGGTAGGEIPVGVDAFAASPVGSYLLSKLGPVTGTDPTKPSTDSSTDPQHLTSFEIGGFGLGGGKGVVKFRIVQGMDATFPVGDNPAKFVGTLELWTFFKDQTLPAP